MRRHRSSLSEVIQSRQVIPRWNSATSAAALGERSASRPFTNTDRTLRSLRIARHDYEQHQSEAAANEYLQTANMLGLANDPLAMEIVATFPRVSSALAQARIIRAREGVSDPATPNQVLSVADHRAFAGRKVHVLRRIVRTSSDRPLAWSELSRQYLILGQDDKARRAMQAAIQLAPDNVYLTRCAARMYTHLDEHGAALKLLHRHSRSEGNPWLLSAEVAISSSIGKTPRNIRHAQDVLVRNRANSHSLSELASAVGTVELNRGSRKRARELFAKSLISPTENSLAQAQWCVSGGESLGIPDAAWQVSSSHEALALAARSEVDFATMMDCCQSWFASEPFSSRPAVLASTVGFDATLRPRAKAFATLGLEYAPTSAALLNNRAVCHAYDGSTDLAFDDLSAAIKVPGFTMHGVALATLGLICYRSGKPELGQECYKKSIRFFNSCGEMESALRASVHWAIEESLFDYTKGERVFNDVRDRCRRVDRSRFPELSGVLAVAERIIPTYMKMNDLPREYKSPAQDRLAYVHAQLVDQIPDRLMSGHLAIDLPSA